ncbi:MAG: AI-2E family transporter [Candidatus Dormibacteria bacterium]
MSQTTEPASPGGGAAAEPQPVSGPPHPHHREPHPVIRVRTLVAAALIVLAVLGLVYVLIQVAGLVLLFLIAVIIAEGIRPLVHRVQELRLPRAAAIAVVFLALLAVLAGIVALLVQPVVSEAGSLATHFPAYERSVVKFVTSIEKHLGISNAQLTSQIEAFLGQAGKYLVTIGGTIATVFADLILVLVMSFLWLTTSGRLKSFIVDLFPPRAQGLVTEVIADTGFRMGGYLRAVAINMVVVGIVTGIACALLQLPDPILLGLFAGITAAIPMVGAFLGIVPLALLGFTVSPEYPLLVLLVLGLVQLLDANTVVPLVMNRVLALPALAVVVALVVGYALAGLIGSLLAVPVAAAIQVMVSRVLVPYVHHLQGRPDPAYLAAFGHAPAAEPGEPQLAAAGSD